LNGTRQRAFLALLDEPADEKGDDLLDCLRHIVGWTWGTYAKHNGAKRLTFF